ncbi:fatty acid desaturase [Chitinivorax sp. B]|uniref:acyl-CoA desaturase n=1 Tax=Chitinivorax sp. B TaxID=2502235 RepID=UPI0010F756C8|nr:fatty acid desaturase [Chitinivorax sp. B]
MTDVLHVSPAVSTKPFRSPVIVADARIMRSKRRLALLTIWIPTLGTALAVALAVQFGLRGLDMALLIGMYTLTMMGLEVSFHRQLSHNAFDSPRWVRAALAICGSMAMQGGVLYWVATHRRHHIHSDTPEDPHSPYYRLSSSGPQKLGWLQGLWHAQLGNMYTDHATNVTVFAKDMLKDPVIGAINRRYWHCVALGLLIPTVIGGLADMSLYGALTGLLWGGLVRIFLVHHVYFANGSFSHMYGGKPFDNGDCSANNMWFGLPTFGSAYQNNHHAFPTSALIGFKWWQPDIGHMFIRAFECVGLASNVKRATPQQIAAKQAQSTTASNHPNTGDRS